MFEDKVTVTVWYQIWFESVQGQESSVLGREKIKCCVCVFSFAAAVTQFGCLSLFGDCPLLFFAK